MDARAGEPDPTEEDGLASIDRPADDPQTRPAVDPDQDAAEQETSQDT